MSAFKWFLFDTIGPFWSLIHTIPRIAMAPSCFPERKRKCLLRRFWDLFVFRLGSCLYAQWSDVDRGQ